MLERQEKYLQCAGNISTTPWKSSYLESKFGAKKYIERSGILEGTYPNLFVVRVKEKSVERRMSFSYVDLLTGTVVLTLKNGEEDIPLLVN